MCSFGYVDGNEIVNHVFSEWISVPSLVVYDPVKEVYYVSSETPNTVTVQSIRDFLDGILAGSVRVSSPSANRTKSKGSVNFCGMWTLLFNGCSFYRDPVERVGSGRLTVSFTA